MELDLNKEKIIERYLAGESTRSIAHSFNVSGPDISRALKRYGVQARPRHKVVDSELEANIVALYAEGMGQVEIANRLGTNQSRVSHYLRRVGYTGYNPNWIPELSKEQLSVLYGTLLGDSSITSRNKTSPRWTCGHAFRQWSWLSWKIAQLPPELFTAPIYKYLNKDFNCWTVKAWSRGNPFFKKIADEFYIRPDDQCTPSVHKKMITQAVLDKVDDLALAVWFCDDGSCDTGNKRNRLVLVVGGVTDVEYQLVESWLRKQGFDGKYSNPGGNCKSFRFTADSSEYLASRIQQFIPQCMRYKLGNLETSMSEINVDELSDEQAAALAAKLALRNPKSAPEPAVVTTGYLLTNTENCDLSIPDLGMGSGTAFEPEVFHPFETKDLAEIYPPEELNKSKYLRKLIADKRLIRGKFSREELEKNVDPLARLAKAHEGREGNFSDPNNQRDYDKRFTALEARDEQEDEATRRRR